MIINLFIFSIYSFFDNKIRTDQLPTLFEKIIGDYKLRDGTSVKCIFYDTSGAQRLKTTIESYYKEADGCILLFDVTNRKSFDDINQYYIPKIKEKCKENIPVIIIGNKIDLEDSRIISIEEASKLAYDNNFLYQEVSCIKNNFLNEIFEEIMEETKAHMEENEHYINNEVDDNIRIVPNNPEYNRRRQCSCFC